MRILTALFALPQKILQNFSFEISAFSSMLEIDIQNVHECG